eukprot:TRINITY_DN27248_c0_g1_i1.p1 TRINITY_DN27248_c0_g1~~TRINITY_DN27248_c0_g1_i1.p1  ORF type:complete len:431 (-),score=39.84 TRINITY_DN27248_c0_g1_i1:60-1292(-)
MCIRDRLETLRLMGNSATHSVTMDTSSNTDRTLKKKSHFFHRASSLLNPIDNNSDISLQEFVIDLRTERSEIVNSCTPKLTITRADTISNNFFVANPDNLTSEFKAAAFEGAGSSSSLNSGEAVSSNSLEGGLPDYVDVSNHPIVKQYLKKNDRINENLERKRVSHKRRAEGYEPVVGHGQRFKERVIHPGFMRNYGSMCYTELWSDEMKKNLIQTRGKEIHNKKMPIIGVKGVQRLVKDKVEDIAYIQTSHFEGGLKYKDELEINKVAQLYRVSRRESLLAEPSLPEDFKDMRRRSVSALLEVKRFFGSQPVEIIVERDQAKAHKYLFHQLYFVNNNTRGVCDSTVNKRAATSFILQFLFPFFFALIRFLHRCESSFSSTTLSTFICFVTHYLLFVLFHCILRLSLIHI